jgi:DNA-binding transcriptional ArsR family regulator
VTVELTREHVAEVLRGRILRGLHARALASGDRLPSARELGAEFDIDHRVVLAAYRELAGEGLVELRQRGGIYVARRDDTLIPNPGVDWMIDLLLQGLGREVPIVEFHDWFRRAVATLRIRAAVVQGSRDQIEGMCRELFDDYGLEATGLDAGDLAEPTAAVIADLRRTDLLVSTPLYEGLVRGIGERVGVPVVIADVRPDLVGGEWRMLLRQPVYVVVSDERFVRVLEKFFAEVASAAENLRILVVGRDDVAAIPPTVPVYLTRAAKEALAGAPIGGRIVPSARVFSADAARNLVSYIVRANIHALSARNRNAPDRTRVDQTMERTAGRSAS